MTSEFEVAAKEAELLNTSHLVDEMQEQLGDRETFVVLLGKSDATFHSIAGGYNRSGGYHVVNLVHEVQGDGSPPSDVFCTEAEVHLDDYWFLEISDMRIFDGEYPDDDYTLSLQVTGYEHGPYSFEEALTEDIDRREQEYSYNE